MPERPHQSSEHHASERGLKGKRDRAEVKERFKDVGPREVGREGMLEKK